MPKPAVSERTERILIAEDDPDALEMVCSVLTAEGYETIGVGQASEALEAWEQKAFDLLITDLFLPDLEGTSLAERVLEANPDAGVIVITAYPSVESTVESIEKQVSSYLIKPVSRERLLISVEKTLERLRLRREREELLGRLHEQVIELEEARWLKKRYFSFIVHELRRPLQAVYGAVSVLNKSKCKDLDEASMFGIINRNLKNMMEMVENVLKLEQTKLIEKISSFSDCSVQNMVDELVRDLGPVLTERNISVSRNIEPDLTVPADGEKLFVILSNLFSNAVRAVSGGTITLSARKEEQAVHFSVSDTGRGMSAETASAVTELLQNPEEHSLRRDGTGIGLTVIRNFVHLHGGRLWFESSEGKGTTFHFTIPLQYVLVQRSGKGTAVLHLAGGGITAHRNALADTVANLLRENRSTITLDIRNVQYMASRDISVIFNLHKLIDDGGGVLKLRNPSWQVCEIMKITQLDQMIDIQENSPKGDEA